MKDEHILDILDGGLSHANSALIEAHAARCENCRKALNAARISSALFQTAETFQPSPFFETKILSALQRERQNLRKPLAAFWRWWQASAALVAAMILMVVSLIALTVFAPTASAGDAQVSAANDNPYSTEAILLNQKARADLTTEQSLELIYDTKK
ncbi:MAG: zf-HC2 domain-containing protein [Pyrinomonadaceae bacterium]